MEQNANSNEPRIFFISGTTENWNIARKLGFWGLPPVKDWDHELRVVGFGRGSTFLACAGPKALFRGEVTSEVYWDDSSAPWGKNPGSGHVWPVRFRFKIVGEINDYWFVEHSDYSFRSVLVDVYGNAKSVFLLKESALDSRFVRLEVIYPEKGKDVSSPPKLLGPRFDSERINSPEELEDAVVDLLKLLGFVVKGLGHLHPYERVPDGLAYFPESLRELYKRLNRTPYFVLWDCKFYVNNCGLTADEERKIKEYGTDYAERAKGQAVAPEFWFLLVGKDDADAKAMQAKALKLSADPDMQRCGCRGVRAVSYAWLRELVEELVLTNRDEAIREFAERVRGA